jgi:hypothetical protein
MLQRGDILIERLTGRRAMVIKLTNAEEVTCRFGDGRLEDRFTFELEPAPSLIGWLLSLVAPLMSRPLESSTPSSLSGRVRPLILRQSGSA